MSLQPDSATRGSARESGPLPFAMKAAGVANSPAAGGVAGGGTGQSTVNTVAGGKDATRDVARDAPVEPVREVSRLEFSSVDAAPAGGADAGVSARLKEEVAALEARLEELRGSAPRQVEEGKLLARLLARKEWEEELDRRIREDRAQVRHVCEEFERERTRYFAAVEGQVVKLALAIAGRVLHREAKMDPLLLSAAVRVALEKVEEESEIRLRVPVAEAEAWDQAFGLDGERNAERGYGRPVEIQIIGDPQMARGECVIETSVGTVELGIEAQMMEIERGFFDLLKKRPA